MTDFATPATLAGRKFTEAELPEPGTYPGPPAPSGKDHLAPESLAAILAGEWVRDRLVDIAGTQPRSLQAALGPSEIGQGCRRRLAFRLAGTPIVNLPDPIKALFGTAMHALLAEAFERIDGGSHRYLVEHRVSYQGVSGKVDLIDRYKRRLIDWKTTSLSRIKQYRRDGVPTNYVVQTCIYAEGAIAEGELIDDVVLVFIPRDGELKDIWAWATQPNKAVADDWIKRMHDIEHALSKSTTTPADIEATPGPMCGYCPNYRKSAADLSVACPGRDLAA